MPPHALSLAACLLALAACGGDGHGPAAAHRPAPTQGARAARTTAPSRPPAPDAAIPADPSELAARMARTDAALRRAMPRWDLAQAPPLDLTLHALFLQRAIRMLARRPDLAATTFALLAPGPRRFARGATLALRDLRRLAAGWPAHEVRTGAAEPLAALRGHYREAQRRFDVGPHVLAAVNFVESDFGRLRNASVAGAQGPMQFMPATWDAYGLGGDIRDPHDAILAGANLLRANGAPHDYARALYAYNPSPLYVDAVRRYARLISGDPAALPILYAFQVFAAGTGGRGERRLTGPGLGR